MGEQRELSRRTLPQLLVHLTAALGAERDRIDDLNVFPVPDGDTGSNLFHTMRAARDAVADSGIADDVATTARRAMLRGARGNSGVIMSQIMSAAIAAIDDGPLDAPDLVGMLGEMRDRARAAVSEPVEGTILTVLDVAADAAGEAGVDLLPAIRWVGARVATAVAATEFQLAANRDAGVVDAGAEGFAILWQALGDHVEGQEPPPIPVGRGDGAPGREHTAAPDGPAFEVMYVVELADPGPREAVVAQLRTSFLALGDSVVVVGDGDLVQAHVHTDDVDAAIAAGDGLGTRSQLQVTRFADQVGACADDPTPAQLVGTATVAVVPGPGIAKMVADLGGLAVHGSAGDLPDVAVLLEAIARTGAADVLVLPGNPNVVPTAQQAARLSNEDGGARLHVVEAASSTPSVLAVLLEAMGPDLDVDRASASAAAARAGQVVPAIRDAEVEIGTVRAGQWLGVVGGDIVAADDDRTAVLMAVVDHLGPGELVTLIRGHGVDDADAVVATIGRHVGDEVEVELLDGGQTPAAWIVGVE